MPWSTPSTRASGYKVTATNWNEYATNFAFLNRVGFTAVSSDVSVTATTVGTANQIASLGSISYENVPHVIEFYCPALVSAAVQNFLILRDSTTVLGTLARFSSSAATDEVFVRYVFTPSAASHTYNVASWNQAAGTWTYNFGTGGTAGDATTELQGHLMIYRLPT